MVLQTLLPVHLAGLPLQFPACIPIIPPGWCLAFWSVSICLLSALYNRAAIRRIHSAGGGDGSGGCQAILFQSSVCMSENFQTKVKLPSTFTGNFSCMQTNQYVYVVVFHGYELLRFFLRHKPLSIVFPQEVCFVPALCILSK